ncbi:hypothetical protein CPB83DRAFT_860775 [Crepidotus variabilis]|uniref:Uncharacterized protein n=1 Tax=Crepidotus variabilis TaxID=179855 RepID=A0A9P6JLB8_9AGAR|nr:hypothetical protein CPB83DRAFT_860775 [Crepidotus variabilis]
MIQRGITSLLLYLRVHALYRSNRYVHLAFGFALLAIKRQSSIREPEANWKYCFRTRRSARPLSERFLLDSLLYVLYVI